MQVTPAQAALWQKLQGFSFDAIDADEPFSHRLARENHWSIVHARRVLEEYRRFLFLAMVAEHPVCPADAVDEAWHLHLIFSRSYWDDLCGQVLQKPLHHQPTRGGERELVKHFTMYEQTLASYERLFGAPPPSDIWESLDKRFHAESRHTRVDRRRVWILPKPTLRLLPWLACGLLVLAGGCGQLLELGGPWDMSGPEFLKLYLGLFGITWAGSWLLRTVVRRGVPAHDASDAPLGNYEIAYLNGFEKSMLQAALASLVHRKYLIWDSQHANVIKAGPDLPADAHPVEQEVYRAARHASTPAYWAIRDQARLKDIYQPIDDDLVRRGLLLTEGKALLLRQVTGMAFVLLCLFGFSKVGVGIERHRPVGFLITLSVAAGIFAFAAFVWKTRITRRGKSLIHQLQTEHASLNKPDGINDKSTADDVIRGVAIFSSVVLVHSSLRYFYRDYIHKNGGSDFLASGDAGTNAFLGNSGDGGSGCTGGGGGGGGGCGGGGGGCGGCGGGGD